MAGCTLNTDGAVRLVSSSSLASGSHEGVHHSGADVAVAEGQQHAQFVKDMSAAELEITSWKASRPGTTGCYPLAAVIVPPDAVKFALAVKLTSSTDTGNSFSFGVAQRMRKTYGDGFGKERTSVGIFQSCQSPTGEAGR